MDCHKTNLDLDLLRGAMGLINCRSEYRSQKVENSYCGVGRIGRRLLLEQALPIKGFCKLFRLSF